MKIQYGQYYQCQTEYATFQIKIVQYARNRTENYVYRACSQIKKNEEYSLFSIHFAFDNLDYIHNRSGL